MRFPAEQSAVQLLTDQIASPIRAVDLGARGKLVPALRAAAAAIDVIGFEPDAREASRLRQVELAAGWNVFVIDEHAVSGRGGLRTLYETARPDASSLLLPSNPGPFGDREIVTTRQISTLAIGEALAEEPVRHSPEYVKIDVQGLEFEILSALEPHHWDSLLVCEVECRVQHHYEGQGRLTDVVQLFNPEEFALVSFEPVFAGGSKVDLMETGVAGRKVLSHGDALFFRLPSARQSPEALTKVALLYGLYGFWDAALDAVKTLSPRLASTVAAALPSGREGLRWRFDVARQAGALIARPSRARRFELARTSLRVDPHNPNDRSWRLSIPKP